MSRKDARRFTFTPNCMSDCLIISITDVGSMPNHFNSENPHIKGICRLEFDDVDFGDKNCITQADAKKILDFVSPRVDHVDLIIVHCEAGISRSAGVCAALMKIFNGNDWDVFNNPRYYPNISCYRTILEAYYDSFDETEVSEKSNHNVEAWRKAGNLD